MTPPSLDDQHHEHIEDDIDVGASLDADSPAEDPPGFFGSLWSLIVTLTVSLALAWGLQAFIVKPYVIPSESMVNTLQIGQRILVDRIGNNWSDPEIGDVIVFEPPADYSDQRCANAAVGVDERQTAMCDTPSKAPPLKQAFVKRVVGLPGDRLSMVGGRLIRNGKQIDEPFIVPCQAGDDACNMPETITVPPGTVYVLGDNRGNSDDGRYWGPLPREQVIGKAFLSYWPANRFGGL